MAPDRRWLPAPFPRMRTTREVCSGSELGNRLASDPSERDDTQAPTPTPPDGEHATPPPDPTASYLDSGEEWHEATTEPATTSNGLITNADRRPSPLDTTQTTGHERTGKGQVRGVARSVQ